MDLPIFAQIPDMFKDVFTSFSDCFRALGFVFERRMAHYFLYPIAITIVLSVVVVQGIDWAVDTLQEWVRNKYLFESEVPADESTWQAIGRTMRDFSDFAVRNVLSVLLWVVFIYVSHKLMKYVVLTVMSPVMAFISERTEQELTGREFPFDWPQFFKDILRGLRIALRNFAIEMGIIVLVWLAGIAASMLIPFLAPVLIFAGTVFTFIVGAYYYGFATMDYTNERRRLDVRNSVRFIWEHKGIAIGNGLVFSLLMVIPIIGAYIGPVFATVMCTAGATISIHNKIDLSREELYLQQTPSTQQ